MPTTNGDTAAENIYTAATLGWRNIEQEVWWGAVTVCVRRIAYCARWAPFGRQQHMLAMRPENALTMLEAVIVVAVLDSRLRVVVCDMTARVHKD